MKTLHHNIFKRIYIILLSIILIFNICIPNTYAGEPNLDAEIPTNTEDIPDNNHENNTETPIIEGEPPSSLNEAIAPTINTLIDAEYKINSIATPLDGSATTTDSGILTYQWYKNNEIIADSTEPTYIPDTSVIGEYKYKIIVTNTLYNENNDVISSATTEINEITIKIITDDSNENSKPDNNKDNIQPPIDKNNKPSNKVNNFDKKPNEKMPADKKTPDFSKKPTDKDRLPELLKRQPFNNIKNKTMPPMNKVGDLKKLKNTTSNNNSSSTSTTTTEDTSYKEVNITDKVITSTKTIKYGDGKIIISVVDDTINNLATIKLSSAVNVIGACLSDSDLKKAYNGKTIKIKVIAKYINKSISTADKDLITEGTKVLGSQVNGLSIGDYLDITVSKKISTNKWSNLTTLKKRLKIVLSLPNDIKQKKDDKYIIRLHDGEYVLIKDTDDKEDTFSFSTKYFSTYAFPFIYILNTCLALTIFL